MPFDASEVSQVTRQLIAGRTRLEAGWCQNSCLTRKWFWPGECREAVCMIGAGGDPGVLLRAIADVGFGEWNSVPAFNDTPGRSKKECLAVYDQAIASSMVHDRYAANGA
jgi:hypothetical protein